METCSADVEVVDLERHNGTITIFNPKTGKHRTVRVKTVRSGKMKGFRLVELLVGPVNTDDYTAFGFVHESGKIVTWKRYRGTDFEKIGKRLERSNEYHDELGLEFKFSVNCRRCNRPLTTPISIDMGIGPDCLAKSK